MAVRTRRPGGGWSTVSGSTNYSNVVANYAQTLASAQIQQKNTDLENKVFNYRNGLLSYSDLIAYINSRIAAEIPGSQKELELKQTLSQVDEYERTKNINLTRSQLEAQFAQGGISASEKRQIEESLLRFFKQGSTEYSEQLANIATARELERVDSNNQKVARLQSELSSGGLTTGEQIQIYKEMSKYAEAGSAERSDIETKIGSLQEQKRKEDNEVKMNQRLSEMLDQYAGGGITNAEALTMNRELQNYVEKGTPEYIDLKQKEAQILGDIAQEIGGGGGGRGGGASQARELASEIAIQTSQLQEIETRFASGEMNPQEYIQQTESVLSLIAPQDIPEGTFDLEDMYALKKRFDDFEKMKNMVQGGQVVPVKIGNQQTLVSLQDLASFKYSDEVSMQDIDPVTGEIIEGSDKTGRLITLVNPDGSERKVAINEDGTFSDVSVTKKQVVNADGTVSTATSYIRSPNKSSSVTDFIGQVKKQGPSVLLPNKEVEPTENEYISSQPVNVESPDTSVDKGSSKKSTSSSNKSSSTKVSSPSATVSNIVKSAVSTVNKASSMMPTVNTSSIVNKVTGLKSTTGKLNVNVGPVKVNLPEFGVSEKVGSILKSGLKKITSLFGKK